MTDCWPIIIVLDLRKFLLPPVWSGCICVFIRNRIGIIGFTSQCGNNPVYCRSLLIVDQKYTVVTGEQAGIVAIVLDKADTMGNRVDDYLNCNRGLLAMDRHGYWHC